MGEVEEHRVLLKSFFAAGCLSLLFFALQHRSFSSPAISAAGFDLASAPAADPVLPMPSQANFEERPAPSGLNHIVVDGDFADGGAAVRAERSSRHFGQSGLGAAAAVFFRFKKSARFRRSGTIRLWTADFLSYPDLRAINERYYRDENTLRFISDTLRSPNFGKVVSRHVNKPDISAFLSAMLRRPKVILASQEVMKQPKISEAVNGLKLPYIETLGRNYQKGAGR